MGRLQAGAGTVLQCGLDRSGGGRAGGRAAGRQIWPLLGSVLFFGICTLISAYAGSLMQLTVLRLLTGLGLGAAMPNAVTLLSEYSPAKHRSLLVNLLFLRLYAGLFDGRICRSMNDSEFWLGKHFHSWRRGPNCADSRIVDDAQVAPLHGGQWTSR